MTRRAAEEASSGRYRCLLSSAGSWIGSSASGNGRQIQPAREIGSGPGAVARHGGTSSASCGKPELAAARPGQKVCVTRSACGVPVPYSTSPGSTLAGPCVPSHDRDLCGRYRWGGACLCVPPVARLVAQNCYSIRALPLAPTCLPEVSSAALVGTVSSAEYKHPARRMTAMEPHSTVSVRA